MDEKAIRAEFEKWADVRGMSIMRRHGEHGYIESYTDHMWMAGRAAISADVEASGDARITAAALAVVKAVDFNHETKETPLKYTVPWLEIVALRKALIAAGIKTEGEYTPAIDTALEGK